MTSSQKIALLKRLLDQARDVSVEDASNAVFQTWKATVERTLTRVFGENSPELEQFRQLKFFYEAIIMSLGRDYSREDREVFRRDFQITVDSIKNYIEELEIFPEEEQQTKSAGAQEKIGRVFVSHASEDRYYVAQLVELLEAVGLSHKRIFCTSLDGYGIDPGLNYLEALRQELSDDALVLFLLSHNFYASPTCLCEMGAAWVLTKEHIPVLVPPFDFDEVKGVLPLTQGVKLNEPLQLNQLKERIEALFCIDPSGSASVWERKRNTVISRLNNLITEQGEERV